MRKTLTENVNKLASSVDRMLERGEKSSDRIEASVEKMVSSADRMVSSADRMVSSVETLSKNLKIYSEQQTKSIKSMNQTINSYIKNEATLIEHEINNYVKTYLKNDHAFDGCNIFDLSDSWKFLNTPTIDPRTPDLIFINKTNHPITEFDGIYVITNDMDFYPSKGLYVRNVNPKMESKSKVPKFRQFVVVEAKHSITNNDIARKVEQMTQFLRYMQINSDDENLTREFKNISADLSLKDFKKEIILIFGSEHMDSSRAQQIQAYYDEWKRMGVDVCYMTLNGERYELFKNDNSFKPTKMLYAKELKITGGKGRKKRMDKV